jgi:hypothetical protein
MIITLKERDLIASTPQKECWICEDILNHIHITLTGKLDIWGDYLRNNTDIREHLRQIIGR